MWESVCIFAQSLPSTELTVGAGGVGIGGVGYLMYSNIMKRFDTMDSRFGELENDVNRISDSTAYIKGHLKLEE